jgi:hypothetical protein
LADLPYGASGHVPWSEMAVLAESLAPALVPLVIDSLPPAAPGGGLGAPVVPSPPSPGELFASPDLQTAYETDELEVGTYLILGGMAVAAFDGTSVGQAVEVCLAAGSATVESIGGLAAGEVTTQTIGQVMLSTIPVFAVVTISAPGTLQIQALVTAEAALILPATDSGMAPS